MKWIKTFFERASKPKMEREYVYINQDGSARELTNDERAYLAEEFHPGDGGRPYIKSRYASTDGWGSLSGFLHRGALPEHLLVEASNQNYKPAASDFHQEMIDDGEKVGDTVTRNADGSVTITPNPALPAAERFEKLRAIQLERQRDRERLARHSKG
ncbi:MAG: hypothetical protein EAZ24_07640 [Burkholderiales bacterium]|nr:MAG: hypothetical protein EAZ24_07640 [Burkholderiales bacterium]TAG83200.1 MAG: hypothetical protein EAZ21_01865 [Betaproteobacteria bacterium]